MPTMENASPYRTFTVAFIAVGGLNIAAGLAASTVTDKLTIPGALLGLGFFLVLSGVILDPRQVRRAATSRSFRYGTLAVYQSILVLGILVCINIFAARHPYSRDLTEDKLFTLAEQTIKILSNLDRPVKAKAFFVQDRRRLGMRQYLEMCERAAKGRFSFEFIDPDRNPKITGDYGVTRSGTTVVECEGRRARITEVSEEALINGIIKVTRGKKRKIYLISGHGEMDAGSGEPNGFRKAVTALENDQYAVKELHLVNEDRMPDDAALVVLAGPQKALFKHEITLLRNYLEAGGSFLCLVDPLVSSGMEGLLAAYGVELGDNIVIDQNPLGKMFGAGELMPVIHNYGKHEITRTLKTIASTFAFVRSVSRAKRPPARTRIFELLKTSKRSWAEKDMRAKSFKFTPGVDRQGPISLGVAVERRLPEKKLQTRLVVIGDSDFASNRYFDLLANGNLFLNACNWLAKEDDLVSIRAKTRKITPLQLTRRDQNLLWYTSVVMLPLFFLTAGCAVWWVRRSM